MPGMPEAATSISTVLGFDYGERRIGIAVGQSLTQSASPLETLNNIKHKPDWDKIAHLIDNWKPQALVVGLPHLLDGTATEMTQRAAKFARQLHGRFGLPVYTVDETLSSFEAESELKGRKKMGQHNKHEIDKMAAALIIESWLRQQDT